MIDPHWQLVDLDPVTWRQIGRFFDPGQYLRTAQPGEHGLFILHEQGNVLRIVDSESGVRADIVPGTISDPLAFAQQLYASGEWQRVHVIDRLHLRNVASTAQASPRRELTLDQYYSLVYQLLWADPLGYVSIPAHPGHWHGWRYQALKDLVSNLPFSPASLALGVLENGNWRIGLILVCESGQIRKITTFEALDQASLPAELSEQALAAFWQQIEQLLAPPAGLLLCSSEVFDAWIAQEEKTQILLEARQQGLACWRWLVE